MEFKFFHVHHNTPIEEIKRQYFDLCKKHHPDMGGSVEDMQGVNVEWDYLRKHNFNIHEGQDGGTYTDWSQDAPDDVTEQFKDIIEQLIHMAGVEIEICGSWLWVGGDTYGHRDELRGMGMRWANKKRRWYKAPKDWKRKTHGELSMEEIRGMYGSTHVETVRRAALTA